MPSPKGYKRDYKQEYAAESPQRKRQRAARNRARYQLMKEGLVKRGDGKHVDHKKPLSKGGSNSRRNLRVRSGNANSSYRRTSTGAMKYSNQR